MMTTGNMQALIRAELWSTQLKEILTDELAAQRYVDWLSEFPDGDTFTIPSIGQATVRDYVENDAVVYEALDTGEVQFQITEYVSSAHYITKKALQDSYKGPMVLAAFVPKQSRAIGERIETDIYALQGQQTASNQNLINGAEHRFVANGTGESMSVADFARVLYSLKKANVPDKGLVGIVDPSVEFTLNTLTNLVNVSNNPKWEGLVTTGMASGPTFMRNIYGFDIYTSNYLADANEQIDSKTTTAGKANLFFSMSGPDILPFKGAFRQMPEVDGEYNKDRQREEFVTTCRYGLKLYRPENFVVVLSDTDVVS